ncbi:MAG: 16S rRNA (cytosine(1402)-N(4))-methyltransferase RsmH [Eudoraea sp.]|uniref:16S rRNA (cytosine(1402)-N(4))-methyltransferase RsmH n=1 Tax=Eudoraea sp. TaxID=1979955 RepID=UPI003C73C61E
METNYHRPVLLKESVDGLNIVEGGIYVDATFGGGGHSREILQRLGPKGKLFAFDQDEEALNNSLEDERFTLINENFRFLRQFLKFYGIKQVDGILADFGVSSHQFDTAARGFSIRFDADLDMRMSKRNSKSAYHVINTYSYDDLRRVLYAYGEVKRADAIAATIVEARSLEPIKTSADLKKVIKKFLPAFKENKILAQIYQAIRIEVNEELVALEEFLAQTPQLLKKGGRLSLISYHSLEDRLAKRFIQTGKFRGEIEKDFYGNTALPFKKVGKLIVPDATEIKSNSRARSGKLRIAERI